MAAAKNIRNVMEQHPDHKNQQKPPQILNTIFRFILGLLGSVFICILILKIIGNFYILLVLLPLADFFLWRSLKKEKTSSTGKWIIYGGMTGFTLLFVGLLLAIVSLNVALQGIIQ